MKQLELKAQAIRARLLRAVDVLDARRHQAVKVGAFAKQAAKPAVLSTLGFVALCGAGALVLGLTVRARRKRTLTTRASGLLQRLDLAPKPRFGSRILERVGVTVLTFALTELVKRATKNFADGRLPDGRLLIGRALEARRHDRLADSGAH